jgi:hypothetical protein
MEAKPNGRQSRQLGRVEGTDRRAEHGVAVSTGRLRPLIVAPTGQHGARGERHDGSVSTRTLIVLAAACAVAILAASAIQILLAR